MADKEDIDQTGNGAPAADIPNLKAKEKERKKAGAAWSGVKPGASPFSGATGGAARAAASAAGAGGSAAAGAAGGAFSLSAFISGLAATLGGKLVLAGLAIALIGGAIVGFAMLAGTGAPGTGEVGDLGALSSSLKVRSAGGDRTGYVASKGEIMFDPAKPAAAKPAEKAPEEAAPAGDAVPATDPAAEAAKGINGNRPGLEHNLSGTKLSSSLGGGFGSSNIMAGSGASKLSQSMGGFNIKGADKGRLTASKNASTGRRTAGAKSNLNRANKAFGQLKVAKGASMLGAGASSAEGARSAAATAFDGSNPDASNVAGGPGTGTGTSGVPQNQGDGQGATDVTAPTTHEGYDGQTANTAAMIAAIAAMAEAAGKMKAKGKMLVLLGLALIAAGCFIWTAYLIPIGIAVCAIGYMMQQQAEQMKAMADAMSAALAQNTTDQNQNRINQYCISQAYNGVPPANCNPPASVTNRDEWHGTEQEGLQRHQTMIRENGYVEGNGGPTP